eukprot:Em0010g316a
MEIDFTYEKEQLLQFVKSKENDHKQEEGDIEGIVEQDEDEQEEDEQQEDEQQEGEAEGEQEEQVEPEGGAPVVFTSLTALFKHCNEHAHGLLARMDFSVNGATYRASNLFGDQMSYATFELNYYEQLKGKIRGVYQSIVKKCVAPKAASCKHENPQGVGKSYGRHKKAR